jgi:hypothetical protein
MIFKKGAYQKGVDEGYAVGWKDGLSKANEKLDRKIVISVQNERLRLWLAIERDLEAIDKGTKAYNQGAKDVYAVLEKHLKPEEKANG